MQYHICRYKYSCILGYPTGYSQPNTPIKWNAKKCGADIIVVRHGEPLPDSRTDISGSSCPPSPTTGAGAQNPMGHGEAIAGNGRCSTQGAAEY